jgi:hypothetical protein
MSVESSENQFRSNSWGHSSADDANQIGSQAPLVGRWSIQAVLAALALAGTLAGYQVISFLPGYLGLEPRSVTVPFRAILAGLYFTIMFMGLYSRRAGIVLSLPVIAVVIFWTLYITRLLLDTVIDKVPLDLPGQDYITYVFGVSLLPMLGFMLTPTRSGMGLAFVLVLSMNTVTCLAALLNNFSDPMGIQTRMAANECLNPIAIGHTGGALFLMVLLHWLHRSDRRTNWLFAFGCGSLAILGLYIVFLAASRGALVALSLLLPVVLWSGWRKGARLWVVLVAGTSVAAILPFIINSALAAGTDLSLYLGSVEAVVNADSAISRYAVIADAWKQFLEHPILGSSLVERNSLFYPHNYVVESFMATGLLGGLSFCFVAVSAIHKSLRLLLRYPAMAWTAVLFLQTLIGGMFSGTLYFAPLFWGLLGVVLVARIPTDQSWQMEPVEIEMTTDVDSALSHASGTMAIIEIEPTNYA